MKFVERSKKNIDRQSILDMMEKTGVSETVAMLMLKRGVSVEEGLSFLYPKREDLHDPMMFSKMSETVERIRLAAERAEKVAVYSDYDSDGICGAAIIYRVLKHEGITPVVYIPDRFLEGYGTNREAFQKLINSGVTLIITVDCGIKSCEDVAFARECGCDVIILDHHLAENLPDSDYILDPKIEGETYPNKNLCGAGVAFKVGCALDEDYAMSLIDIAGVATIGDMVSLQGENRTISALGLYKLRRDPCGGFAVLAGTGGLAIEKITSYGVSFGIVPRMNAAGRMEHGKIAFRLLVSDDRKTQSRMAKKIEQLNIERKKRQKEIEDSAVKRIRERGNLADRRLLWEYDDTWDQGVVGLAASAVARRFSRPALVLSQNGELLTGSARSIKDVNIYNAFDSYRDSYERFGGHAQAAGLTIRKEIADDIFTGVERYLKDHNEDDLFLRTAEYDLVLDAGTDFRKIADEMEMLEPYGIDNPEPRFLIYDMIPRNVTYMGERKHIKFDLFNGALKGLWFYAAHDMEDNDSYNAVGSVSKNTYNGSTTVQFIVDEIVPDDSNIMRTNGNEYVRTGLTEILAFKRFLEEGNRHTLNGTAFFKAADTSLEQSRFGTLIVANSSMGIGRCGELITDDRLDVVNSIHPDCAENCLCMRSAGADGVNNYRNVFAVGAFSYKWPAIHLYDDGIKREYLLEAGEYFLDEDSLENYLEGFGEVIVRNKKYPSISAFLGECMIDCREPSLKKLWFALNVYCDNKLIEITKGDKIYFNRKNGDKDWHKSKVFAGVQMLLNMTE
ncbi:MAG: single-stranded-DNA-specific exonuclease RecJ [Clostridiales bacterium]|nr:MAG: single-stranded-DNA-specific exonuclease RecJ [Clostridiales bacterium]